VTPLAHLGVDSRDIFANKPRGVGKALTELFRHLLPLIPDWDVTMYTNRNGTVELPPPAHIKEIDIWGDRFDAWERIRLPIAALNSRLDLLHCPSQTAPSFTPCPLVLTVHDVIPLRMDDGWSAPEVGRFRRALARSAENAKRIITVSEFTKRDLLSIFNIQENKVDVVYWGVDGKIGQAASQDLEILCSTQKIRDPFFVAFGGDAPRKNVPRIIEALNFFVREVSGDVQLLLLGVPPRARAKFAAIAENRAVSHNMIQIGYVPDSVVTALVARAEAVVYPSLYEGFGLPILEAMAVGCPVITSSVTSMPEIAGDAAILVDPQDTRAISKAMQECYLNDSVKQSLRARGFRRIKDFTWEQTASATLASYFKALN
jgi:glycosyltransferase involved in cell wall biosynthesis